MTREARFQQAVDEWKQWAATADRSENGWETDFPRWPELLDPATRAMTDPDASPRELELLSFCWSVSSETEERSGAAAGQNDRCLPALEYLARHGDRRTRWQVFAAIESVNDRTVKLLETGLDLAQSSGDPALLSEVRTILRRDPVEHVRRAAEESPGAGIR